MTQYGKVSDTTFLGALRCFLGALRHTYHHADHRAENRTEHRTYQGTYRPPRESDRHCGSDIRKTCVTPRLSVWRSWSMIAMLNLTPPRAPTFDCFPSWVNFLTSTIRAASPSTRPHVCFGFDLSPLSLSALYWI